MKILILTFLMVTNFGANCSVLINKVSIGENTSSFGYYNVSPENPNGTLISYVTYPHDQLHDAELWVSDINLKNHRKISHVKKANLHNGALQFWLTNEKIIFSNKFKEVAIVDVNTKNVIYRHPGYLGYNSHGDKFILTKDCYIESPLTNGIYTVNFKNNEMEQFISFKSIEESFKTKFSNLDSIWNPKFSPDGGKIAFRAKFKLNNNRYKNLLVISEFQKILTVMDMTPLHFQWYGNSYLIGYKNHTLQKWDLSGNRIETLADSGNHFAINLQKKLIVTDTPYNSNPLELKLYSLTNFQFRMTLVSTIPNNLVWKESHHINPAFSKNTNRIYFNNPYSIEKSFASYYDMSNLEF